MQQAYGFEGIQKPIPNIADKDAYKANYKNFVAGLDSLRDSSDKIGNLYKKHSQLDISKVQFKGIILTDQEKNLKPLANATFIRAAEIGATVDIVPYIKPYK